MIGRGAYGRPWLAGQLDAALAGADISEPELGQRLDIALTHFDDALGFYGERLGLKVFRKHLGWYVEAGPAPADPAERRRIKGQLCRLEQPHEVRAGLKAIWAQNAPSLGDRLAA
jgi:tRNA-dihydrouridine synthase